MDMERDIYVNRGTERERERERQIGREKQRGEKLCDREQRETKRQRQR